MNTGDCTLPVPCVPRPGRTSACPGNWRRSGCILALAGKRRAFLPALPRPSPFDVVVWAQNYNPLGNAVLSTIVAALPALALLGCIALKIRVHFAALAGLVLALLVAILVCHMPAGAAVASALYGAAFGLFPIGWIILNIVF